MDCFNPQLIPSWRKVGGREKEEVFRGKDSARDFKNWLEVTCGSCPPCLNRRSNDWAFRIMQEVKYGKGNYFLTLTYNEENLPFTQDQPSLVKKDLQDFHKRLRRRLDTYQLQVEANRGVLSDVHPDLRSEYLYYGLNPLTALKTTPMTYYAVGEYSPKGRPHYHGIYTGIPPKILRQIPEIWNQGMAYAGGVTNESVRYVTSYIVNRKVKLVGQEDEFNIQSQGLGKAYSQEKQSYHRRFVDSTVRLNGVKMAMPRYIKEKVFDDEERQILGQLGYEAWMQQKAEKRKELLSKGIDPDVYEEEQKKARIRQFKLIKKNKI